MAAAAVAGDACVIEIRGCPCNSRVAIITVIATRQMCRMFSGRSIAIMTGAAAAKNLRVIHGVGRHPGHRVMAIFTDIRCLHVARIFAGGIAAVVAARTVSRDVGVIKISRDPAIRRMTIVTTVSAGNVIGILASRGHAVMAGSAAAENIAVVNSEGWRKQIRRMTVFTGVGA